MNFTISNFAKSFGTTEESITTNCGNFIATKDFQYKILKGRSRDEIILTVLKKIDSDTQIIGSSMRTQVWESGWAENLKEYMESDNDLSKLIPKFIRSNQVIRLRR